jgi:hypothetical protein
MGTPSLDSDESIILTMQDIVVNAVRMEVILTSKRFILVESGQDRIHHEDIPFETIGSVVAGENARFEPTIILSTISPTGATRTVELIFFRRPGIIKTGERDQLIAKLKEHISPSLVQVKPTYLPPSGLAAEVTPAISPETKQNSRLEERSASQMPPKDLTTAGTPHPEKSFRRASILDRIPLKAIPALLVIIVAVFGGAITYVQIQHEKPVMHSEPGTIPPITTVAITNPAPEIPQTPPQEVHPQPSSPPPVIIPTSGIWVRIKSSGTFIGSVGGRGVFRQVNATGDRFYQIPIREGIVDVSVEKQDATGDQLVVEIYKDGTMLSRGNTTIPQGIVDLHVALI